MGGYTTRRRLGEDFGALGLEAGDAVLVHAALRRLGPVLGGRLSIIGPVLGASFLKPMQDFLRGWLGGDADALYLVLYGAVLAIGILLLPKGAASYVETWHRRQYGGAGGGASAGSKP